MKARHKTKSHCLHRLSMRPLTPEAALAAFMQVDPGPVLTELKKLRQKKGKRRAFPTG